ncbi:MAG: orotate phosphoribosyltransferase [Chrysothrix sp. TS-e1954]|nr:MAG: orotate phosphoribosyltransferase [Chrysothrix sp. TS-e1954]
MSTITPAPPSYKHAFLTACLDANVLTFGTYTLKSGRVSPYFFNAGLFLHSGHLVNAIAEAYASALIAYTPTGPSFDFDVIFGPAMKGITLCATVLGELTRKDPARYGGIGCTFNRKTEKSYGDGGLLVGAPLKGKRVLIIDDVLTAGTAIREAITLILAQGGTLAGIIVAFDRMEKMPAPLGPGGEKASPEEEVEPRMSAIGQVRKEFGVPVLSIVDLDDVLGVLGHMGSQAEMERVGEYKRIWGASN